MALADLLVGCGLMLVDDVRAAAGYRELRDRGVEFSLPPTQQHFGWRSLFADPDGTRYALGQWP